MEKSIKYVVQDDRGNYIATYRDPGYTIRYAKRTPHAVAVKRFTVITEEEEIWRKDGTDTKS